MAEPRSASSPWAPERFDQLYREHPDPWDFDTSPYEQGRYDDVLEVLPARCSRMFEPGCAEGALTERLAGRCDALLAIDPSPTAVERARRRHLGSHVRLAVGRLPDDIPEEAVDVVVASEVLYYGDPTVLPETVRSLAGALNPGGTLVACHWVGSSPDHAATAADVHEALRGEPLLALDLEKVRPGYHLTRWRR